MRSSTGSPRAALANTSAGSKDFMRGLPFDPGVPSTHGIQLGQVFFGESMFSLERDASKVALARLVDECRARDIKLIDCQVASAHLAGFGAREVSRSEFARFLSQYARRAPQAKWPNEPQQPASMIPRG